MNLTQKDRVSDYLKKCGYIETSISKDYLINTDGQIYSLKSSRLLKPYGKRYLYITILNQKYYVHRLVAEAFISNPNNLPCVNHKDGNKLNNCVDNLEWCTYSHNNKEAYKLKLKQPTWSRYNNKAHPNFKYRDNWKTQKLINQYDKDFNFICTYNSSSSAERATGIQCSHINECCNNKRKTAGGYIWKFK